MGFTSGGSGGGSIASGSDVILNNIADSQVLAYNASVGKWENTTNTATKVSIGGISQSTLNIDPTPITITTLGGEISGLSSSTWTAIDARIAAAISAATSNSGGTLSPDTTAPTTSGTPVAVSNAGYISISWTASTDNIGVTGYNVYRSDSANILGIAASTSYIDYTTAVGTSYTYTVKARDAAGNFSVASSPSNSVASTDTVVASDTSRYTSDTFTTMSADILSRSTEPRASGGGFSATWTGSTAGTLGVANGQVVHGSTNATYFAGIAEPSMNLEIGFVLNSLPAGDSLCIDLHRQVSTASTTTSTYRLTISTGGALAMQKVINGTATVLGSMTGGAAVAGDVFRFRYLAGVLTLYKNGTQINTASDSGITATGYAGFFGLSSNTGVGIANFYMDGLSVNGATYVQDLFNIANGSLTTAETGQTWTTISGTWNISGDKVVQPNSSGVVIINAGISTMDVQAQLVYQTPATTGVVGLVVLATDLNNLIVFAADNGVLKLYKYDSGTKSTLASGPSQAVTNGSANIYRVAVAGSLITGYVDGVSKIAYAMTPSEATKYSAYTEAGLISTGYSATLFDNFTVKRIA